MRLMKKTGIFFSILLLMSTLPFFEAKAAFMPPFEVSSNAVYLVNLNTGSVLYAKNEKQKVQPAVLSQIMTQIIALTEIKDQTTQITAPSSVFNELYGKNTYTADIRPLETLSAKDFLYGLFLQNSYEAALTLANHISGSAGAFVAKMNEMAKTIGAVDTNFANPTGMDDDSQFTTAHDIFLITRYAIDNVPGFMDMSNTVSYTLPATDKTGARALSANNLMINRSGGSTYYYQHANGVKTGTTSGAGRCLVTTATKGGYTYLLVILGAPITDANGKTLALNAAFTEAKTLLNWAFDDFSLKSIVKMDETVADVPVKLSFSTDHMLLRPEKDFMALLPSQADASSVQKTVNVPDSLRAPIKKGDVMGTMSFTVAGETIGEVNLIATQDVSEDQLMYLLDFVESIFASLWFKILLVSLLALFAVYVVVVIISNKKKNRYKVIRRRKL